MSRSLAPRARACYTRAVWRFAAIGLLTAACAAHVLLSRRAARRLGVLP